MLRPIHSELPRGLGLPAHPVVPGPTCACTCPESQRGSATSSPDTTTLLYPTPPESQSSPALPPSQHLCCSHKAPFTAPIRAFNLQPTVRLELLPLPAFFLVTSDDSPRTLQMPLCLHPHMLSFPLFCNAYPTVSI